MEAPLPQGEPVQDSVSSSPSAYVLKDEQVDFWMVAPATPQLETLTKLGWSEAYRDDVAIVMVREPRETVAGEQLGKSYAFP